MYTLEGKIALITGATRGIGRAIALSLGAAGATVLGTATRQEGADAISAYLSEAGVTGQGYVMDITQANSVKAVLAEVAEAFGAPAILVNNAGVTRDNLFLRMKEEEWDTVIDTNLSGVCRVTKGCIKSMIKARFGRIINISSLVGVSGNPGQANYAAAKAGVIGFSKSLALEVATRGVTVNVIAPGFIETDMTSKLTDAQKDGWLQRIPMQRLGQVEDIASAVNFLASDAAAYITGQTLHINGGLYLV